MYNGNGQPNNQQAALFNQQGLQAMNNNVSTATPLDQSALTHIMETNPGLIPSMVTAHQKGTLSAEHQGLFQAIVLALQVRQTMQHHGPQQGQQQTLQSLMQGIQIPNADGMNNASQIMAAQANRAQNAQNLQQNMQQNMQMQASLIPRTTTPQQNSIQGQAQQANQQTQSIAQTALQVKQAAQNHIRTMLGYGDAEFLSAFASAQTKRDQLTSFLGRPDLTEADKQRAMGMLTTQNDIVSAVQSRFNSINQKSNLREQQDFQNANNQALVRNLAAMRQRELSQAGGSSPAAMNLQLPAGRNSPAPGQIGPNNTAGPAAPGRLQPPGQIQLPPLNIQPPQVNSPGPKINSPALAAKAPVLPPANAASPPTGGNVRPFNGAQSTSSLSFNPALGINPALFLNSTLAGTPGVANPSGNVVKAEPGHPARPTLSQGLSVAPSVGTPAIIRAPGSSSNILNSSTRGMGPEDDKGVIGKRKLQELLESVAGPNQGMEAEVEDLLLEVADEFIDSVTKFSCKLAQHRGSDRLEAQDVQLHLDQTWGIRIPGASLDEVRQSQTKKANLPANYLARLAAVKADSSKRARIGA